MINYMSKYRQFAHQGAACVGRHYGRQLWTSTNSDFQRAPLEPDPHCTTAYFMQVFLCDYEVLRFLGFRVQGSVLFCSVEAFRVQGLRFNVVIFDSV